MQQLVWSWFNLCLPLTTGGHRWLRLSFTCQTVVWFLVCMCCCCFHVRCNNTPTHTVVSHLFFPSLVVCIGSRPAAASPSCTRRHTYSPATARNTAKGTKLKACPAVQHETPSKCRHCHVETPTHHVSRAGVAHLSQLEGVGGAAAWTCVHRNTAPSHPRPSVTRAW